jgi:hypothetical protein
MSREEARREPPGKPGAGSEALTAPDPEAALRDIIGLWAEQKTCPETLARAEKFGVRSGPSLPASI